MLAMVTVVAMMMVRIRTRTIALVLVLVLVLGVFMLMATTLPSCLSMSTHSGGERRGRRVRAAQHRQVPVRRHPPAGEEGRPGRRAGDVGWKAGTRRLFAQGQLETAGAPHLTLHQDGMWRTSFKSNWWMFVCAVAYHVAVHVDVSSRLSRACAKFQRCMPMAMRIFWFYFCFRACFSYLYSRNILWRRVLIMPFVGRVWIHSSSLTVSSKRRGYSSRSDIQQAVFV